VRIVRFSKNCKNVAHCTAQSGAQSAAPTSFLGSHCLANTLGIDCKKAKFHYLANFGCIHKIITILSVYRQSQHSTLIHLFTSEILELDMSRGAINVHRRIVGFQRQRLRVKIHSTFVILVHKGIQPSLLEIGIAPKRPKIPKPKLKKQSAGNQFPMKGLFLSLARSAMIEEWRWRSEV
jgi:hypothetical protein